MMYKRLLLLFSILCILYSCTNTVKPKQEAVKPVKDTSAIGKFIEQFDSSKLPLLIPDDFSGKARELDSKAIEALCANKSFLAPFGIKDVPDMGKNASESKYYGEGMFTPQKKGYYGVIIRKKAQGEYYFLCTLNAHAELINGICVAFNEGDGVNILKRSSTINEDYSVEVMQSDVSGVKDPTAKSAFFEIRSDGTINPIKKGM